MKLLLIAASAVAVLGNQHNLSHEKDEQLAKITENRRDANKLIKIHARSMGLKLDPDTWCSIGLTSPSCWEEFTETVWKPTSFNNLVPKKEGKPLHQCVTKCTWADWFADIAGVGYEEKREKREDYGETGIQGPKGPNGYGNVAVWNGCEKCCETIPMAVLCLKKVRAACPDLDFTSCGNVFLNPSNDY